MKYGIINMQTGEIVRETSNKGVATQEVNYEVNKETLLSNSENTLELVNFLYRQMKKTGKIDSYGMIKVDGFYISQKYFEVGATAGVFSENLFRLKGVLSFRGFIKKTSTVDCESWSEVMVALGVETSNQKKVSAFKKLLKGNDIIRENTTPSKKKVFVVNPNIIRNGSHTSDFCIATFKDVTLCKVDRYNTYIMYLNGFIEYKDIAF